VHNVLQILSVLQLLQTTTLTLPAPQQHVELDVQAVPQQDATQVVALVLIPQVLPIIQLLEFATHAQLQIVLSVPLQLLVPPVKLVMISMEVQLVYNVYMEQIATQLNV